MTPGVIIPVVATAMFNELFKKLSNNSVLVSIVNEVVGGMRTVRSMSGEEKEASRYQKQVYKGAFVSVGKSVSLGVSTGLVHGCLWAICLLT